MVSYYSNYGNEVPFYSFETALELIDILMKKVTRNEVFTALLTKLANKQTTKKSPLLPILHSLVDDGDLILLDEPFTNLDE